MPVGVVKTKADEKKWKKAKDIVHKEKKGNTPWALVNHIFQNMSKAEDEQAFDEAMQKAMESDEDLPADVHLALHDWWKKNRSRYMEKPKPSKTMDLLDPKKMGDVKQPKVAKSDEELTHLQKSLAFLRETLEGLAKAADKGAAKKMWQPSRMYEPHEHAAMAPLKELGFNDQEAAHVSGVDKSKLEPNEYGDMVSRYHAPEPSDRMYEHLKAMANKVEEDRQTKRGEAAFQAPEHNPVLAQAHYIKQRTANTGDDYGKALQEAKASGAFDGLEGFKLAQATNVFRKKWHKDNLDAIKAKAFEEGDDIRHKYIKSQVARTKELASQTKDVLTGGQAMPADESALYSEQPEIGFDNEQTDEDENE